MSEALSWSGWALFSHLKRFLWSDVQAVTKVKETKLWFGSAITEVTKNKVQWFWTILLKKHSYSLWKTMRMAPQELEKIGEILTTDLGVYMHNQDKIVGIERVHPCQGSCRKSLCKDSWPNWAEARADMWSYKAPPALRTEKARKFCICNHCLGKRCEAFGCSSKPCCWEQNYKSIHLHKGMKLFNCLYTSARSQTTNERN